MTSPGYARLRGPAVAAPEVVTPIKPSEALRLGRLTRPLPRRGRRFDFDGQSACAVGAMQIAYGADGTLYSDADWASLEVLGAQFPRHSKCPVEGWPYDGYDIVWHLNDVHWYTDDQIVAYLESLGL